MVDIEALEAAQNAARRQLLKVGLAEEIDSLMAQAESLPIMSGNETWARLANMRTVVRRAVNGPW